MRVFILQIRTKETKSHPVAQLACRIVQLVLTTPALFLPLVDIIANIRGCSRDLGKRIEGLLARSVEEYPKEAQQLKVLLVRYFTTPYKKWDVDRRRGYVLEEIVSSLKPEALGFAFETGVKRYREGRFCDDSGQPLCGDSDLDVIFTDGKRFEGIECKVKLSNWLSCERGLRSDAITKLTYIKCLMEVFVQHCRSLRVHFATLDDTFPYQDLGAYGYPYIQVLNTNFLDDAIKRNKAFSA